MSVSHGVDTEMHARREGAGEGGSGSLSLARSIALSLLSLYILELSRARYRDGKETFLGVRGGLEPFSYIEIALNGAADSLV